MNSNYLDVIAHVLNTLKDNFGEAYFKAYFEGDPFLIGQSSIPAICVAKQSSQYDVGPTGMDNVTEVVVVKLILNKKDDYGASPTDDLTERKLRILTEGRDSSGNLLAQSVLGILRTNLTLQSYAYDQSTAVDYGIVPRPAALPTEQPIITSEAHITLTLSSHQIIDNRN